MTLKERIKANETIYVGSATSFLYISDNPSIDEIHKESERLKKILVKRIYMYECDERTIPKRLRNAELLIKELDMVWKKHRNPVTKTEMEKIKRIRDVNIHKLALAKERIPIVNQQLSEWVNLEDRKIIREYRKSDGVVIIIEGDECGDFWCKEEFEKRRR